MGPMWLLITLLIITLSFFFVLDFKIVYYITTINPRSRYLGKEKKNILCHNLFGDKIIQTCLNVHETHVTANNSTNNNVVFFFYFRFENSVLQQLLIFYHNALDKRGKIFCVTTHLETKSFKTLRVKFRKKFNFNNYPQKSQMYRWGHKFQATGSVNNPNKKVCSISKIRICKIFICMQRNPETLTTLHSSGTKRSLTSCV